MAISQLIEQTLAQHISNPRVISYAGTKKDEVQGRFIAANRVYNFVLDKKGVSYSPAGRNDSLLFSALFLERLDAVRKPKIGNDRCNAGKSYQCGKTCISNLWKCRKGVKDVNDARRIASILASTNEKLKARASGEVSEKALARGKALVEARQNREATPKVERTKPDDADALKRLEQLTELGKEVSKKTTQPSEVDLARKTNFNQLGSIDARQKFPQATKEIEEKIRQNPKFAVLEQIAEKANRLGSRTEGSRYFNSYLSSSSPISLVGYFAEGFDNKYLTKAETNKAKSAAKSIAKTSLGNPESLHSAKLIEAHLTQKAI